MKQLVWSLGGVCLLLAQIAPASVVEGHYCLPLAKGQPVPGCAELYEFNAFLCPYGTGTGNSVRTGANPGQPITSDGWFYFANEPGGLYSMVFVNMVFFPRPLVVPGVSVPTSGTVIVPAVSPNDYSMLYPSGNLNWTLNGGDPWIPGVHVAEQSFVAQGQAIVRASMRAAGYSGVDRIRFTIHTSTGVQVGPAATSGNNPGVLGDVAGAWHGGEVPTTPGQTYWLRVQADNGTGTFAIVARNDGGTGYTSGHLRTDGLDRPDVDGCFVVGADNDGTITSYNNNRLHTSDRAIFDNTKGDLDWSNGWGQTWVARGTGLAGVMYYYATLTNNQVAIVTIHQGTPNGMQIGPAKGQHARSLASNLYFQGVAYYPGEITLVPGQTYFARVSTAEGSNFAYRKYDPYAQGQGYVLNGSTWESAVASGEARDLDFEILEYAPPAATLTPTRSATPTRTVTPAASDTQVCCLGDADGNAFINAEDFRSVRDHFGQPGGGVGDANCDGFVNAIDYYEVRNCFGTYCPLQ